MVIHTLGGAPLPVDSSQPATRRLVRVFGVLVGFVGAEHGLGELLQGDRVWAGPVIQSWPDNRFFRIENGEPAFTLLSRPVTAGVLTLVVATAFTMRAWFADRGAHPRRDLLVLAVVLFLVGGGFGPPLLGLALTIFPVLPLLDVIVGVSDAWILPVFLAASCLSVLATVAARARDSGTSSARHAGITNNQERKEKGR